MEKTTQKEINPALKSALELGPTLLFFVAYLRIKDDTFVIAGTEYSGFIVAALGFIPVLLASMGVLWYLTGKLSRMQVVTAVMVIFFGGLTAWFNDERFFKMKTTLVYGLLAAILGFGLLRGRSYLAYVMGELMPLQEKGWMILTQRLALAFAALAVGNEIVWRSFSTELWVKIETFGFPIVLMVFLWVQIMALQKYVIEEEGEAK